MTSTSTETAGSTDGGAAVFYGFAAAVAMWAVGFTARLDGVRLPDSAQLAVLALVPLAAGWYAGRRALRPVRCGAAAGLVTGTVNLLVLFSVIGRGPGGISPLWVPGSVALQSLLSAGGAALGGHLRRPPTAVVNWHSRFAVLAAASVLILIIVGGLVTTLDAGLSVPDWPSSYGYTMFLFPLSKMVGNIYYEHAHRLFGSLAGLITVVLAGWTWRRERRGWVRLYGLLLLLLVIGQGVLGGLRVVRLQPALAVVHAVLAQTFFAACAALVLFLSFEWQGKDGARMRLDAKLRALTAALLAAVWLQLIVGAALRHFGWGLHVHLLLAAVVLTLAAFAVTRVLASGGSVPLLPRAAGALLILVVCQLLLGLGTWMILGAEMTDAAWPPLSAVLVTTAHVAVGALILATAGVLTLRVFRCTRVPQLAGSAKVAAIV